MNLKKKIVLVAILTLSFNVNGQDFETEDIKTVSGVDNILENVAEIIPDAVEDAIVNEPTEPNIQAVDVIPEVPAFEVRSGKYQLLYDTITGAALEPVAGAIGGNVGESERQLWDPTSTATTNNEYAHIDGRVLPTTTYQSNGQPYVITNARLTQIRSNFLYWFYDQGGTDNQGDYQRDIHTSTPQIHKNFNFQLPFFGFRFNYTWISINGYIYFSDPPDHFTYPLSFPVPDWPNVNDPSFIGIFFSKCRIGSMRPMDSDQRRPGIYFRMDRDLQNRTDQLGVEMRERLTWDIQQGVIGSEIFFPKHAITITWKNMSFTGGIDNSLFVTNTFQMVLATDEVFTYAMFNYLEINWSAHTEAGGDPSTGEGGVPAYIGFNAGNGTQSYEYKPYSQASVLRDLTRKGCANGFPGRHIFRIDEKILLSTCNKDIGGCC